MSGPKIGELCAGYGGLGMGAKAVLGGEVAWVSDIDKGANKILAHRFPGVPNIGDMTAVDWSQVEPVDILTGGTPCQDLSHAGKRAGMTEGTRSNLWVAMREAIAQLKPRLVVWENVGGAFSATATSEVEPCAGCLGDGGDEHALRALHRVLGDLASLGFDAEWVALRAADVGAPHSRLRVFVAAYPEGDSWWLEHRDRAVAGHAASLRRIGGQAQFAGALDEPAGNGAGSIRGLSDAVEDASVRRPARRTTDAVPSLWSSHGDDTAAANSSQQLLPTPTSSDTNGAGAHGDGGLDLRTAVSLMPTPMSRDHKGAGPADLNRKSPNLSAIGALLPTPAVNDMGEGKTVEAWDEWTAKMQAAHGNGNGHGKSLAIEAQRLLPTPTSRDSAASGGSTPSDVTLTDAVVRTRLGSTPNPRHQEDSHGDPTEARPGEELRDVRQTAHPQAICEREARGSERLSETSPLFAELREHPQGGHSVGSPVPCEAVPEAAVRGVHDDQAAPRSPQGPELAERRPCESSDAVCELPSETALARGSGATPSHEPMVAWGQYEAAIRRWESVLGRPAPAPTQLSKKGTPQLSARFSEFLMGLPAGWVTDVPGITRNEALKALGNGVVWQQAAAALRFMLAHLMRETAA